MTTIPLVSAQEAQQVLRDNDRGGYCVPTRGLYPFQWMWDSGFTTLGWRTFDEARAWQELAFTLRGQWADGMVPHIVFHREDAGYFPGPDAWGTRHDPPTSGITDPPVLASMALRLLRGAHDRQAALVQVRDLYPKLYAFHAWLHRYRDPESTGVLSILHPWETGEDNSPSWDAALSRVAVRPDLMPIHRRDTQHVEASQRPHQTEYQKYMTLVQNFRDAAYDPVQVVQGAQFRVAAPGFNAIALRAERDLLTLAHEIGADAGDLPHWIRLGEAALDTFWIPQVGAYRARDLLTGEQADVTVSSSFLPLYAGGLPAGRAEHLAAMLEDWGNRSPYLVPSTEPGHPRFEAQRYWRGPVWSVVNWMIAEGLSDHGFHALARRVRHDTRRLVEQSGFHEYFNPETGEGLGGGHFTWTAAIHLALLEE